MGRHGRLVRDWTRADRIGSQGEPWDGTERLGMEAQSRTARSLRTGREWCGRLGMGRTRWARVGRRGQDGIGQSENGWERQARNGWVRQARSASLGMGRLDRSGRQGWVWRISERSGWERQARPVAEQKGPGSRGEAGLGAARSGEQRQRSDGPGAAGKARMGEEQLAAAGMGAARNGSRGCRVGDGRTLARTGRLRPGLAGWGAARQSSRGLEHRGLVGRITDWQGRLGVSWPGTVWRRAAGKASHVESRSGRDRQSRRGAARNRADRKQGTGKARQARMQSSPP